MRRAEHDDTLHGEFAERAPCYLPNYIDDREWPPIALLGIIFEIVVHIWTFIPNEGFEAAK
jgi:hypothetical protein